MPDAQIIDRTLINAWDDENFVAAVKATGHRPPATGHRQVIMAGLTTNVCLSFPAIAAAGAGYDVYGVIDAPGSVSNHSLQVSLFRMSQAGVKIADSGMVLAELLRDWASDCGPEMGQVFGRREPTRACLPSICRQPRRVATPSRRPDPPHYLKKQHNIITVSGASGNVGRG